MRGFKGSDLLLSVENAALAKRIGEMVGIEFRAALREHRFALLYPSHDNFGGTTAETPVTTTVATDTEKGEGH